MVKRVDQDEDEKSDEDDVGGRVADHPVERDLQIPAPLVARVAETRQRVQGYGSWNPNWTPIAPKLL